MRKSRSKTAHTPFFCTLLVLLMLAGCSTGPQGTSRLPADPDQRLIYHNGIVLTMDPDQPAAEAAAFLGDRIEAVGTDEDMLSLAAGNNTVIDLEGRVLMPGFVDAHTHLLNDHRSQGLSLDEAQMRALRNGITTLGTLYVDNSFLKEIRAFDAAGYLRVRTGLYLVATDPCGRKQGDWWQDHHPTREPGEMLRVNGVKIFTDGGACGGVALSFELEPGMGTGDLWFEQEELNAMVQAVHDAGYQAAVHAIGDRAVEQTLNAFETVLAGEPNQLRHRMEHVSVIAPDQLARFGELGIHPVLMGEFPNCTPYGPPVPERYGHMEWPWRALRSANPDLQFAWHSDVPFQSINPFDHFLGFVTRIDRVGQAVCPPPEWLTENTLPIEEVLAIMTVQSAYVLDRDKEVGSLAPGKLADYIVLQNNPLEQESGSLADNRVLLTVVGGKVAFCWPANPELCPGHTNRSPARLPDTRPPVPVRWLAAVLIPLLPVSAMLLRRRYALAVSRVGAAAGFLAGLAWIMASFLDWDGFETMGLFIVTPLLMAIASAGLAADRKQGRFAQFSLWLALAGATTFSYGGLLSEWFRAEEGWFLFLLGLLSHAIGLFLFGLANLKSGLRSLPGMAALLSGIFGGLVPYALSFVLGEASDLPFMMFLIAIGGGWLVMGTLVMWMSIKTPAGSNFHS